MSRNEHHLPRLALIGVTGYGAIYWRQVHEWIVTGKAVLRAAVVVNPDDAVEVLAEMKVRGTRVYASYEEMVSREAGEVDLCLIPTGIAWHARMTVAALRAGMNVLVEKPLAGSLADVRAIQAAESLTGRWVAVGFQDLYSRRLRWLKEVLCDGGIGTLRRVRMIGLWPRPVSYFGRNHWAGKLEVDDAAVLDSPLNNAFAHFVNLSFFLAGSEVDSAAAVRPTQARLWRAHSIETFDTAFVVGESGEGVRFEFFVSHACPLVREPEIRIEGSSGVVEWYHKGPVALYPEGGDPVIREPSGGLETRREMFDAALEKVTRPVVSVCTTSMAEAHTGFIEKLHRFAPIQQIHPAEVEWKTMAKTGDRVPTIRGLDDAFTRLVAPGRSNMWGGFLQDPSLFDTLANFRPACLAAESKSESPVSR